MLKKFLRCISTLLVAVLLVNMVPVQAIGSTHSPSIEQINETEQIVNTPIESEIGTESADIVAEIPEGRTEYSKEFLLSNGLHIATVYAEPVHYKKDGKWENIDNTLVASIDGTYKNTAGPWEVSFPQSFGSTQAITVTKDGYTLSFGMPQKLTNGGNSGAVVMSADSTAESLASAQAATATAQVDSKAALLSEKANAQHPETVLDKLSSRLTYENVHTDTNVIYDLSSNQVKESIVLAKQDPSLRGFRYTLRVGTMVPVLQNDGSILFYDESQSQIVMVMPAPYLLDAEYEISTDITVTLTGQNGSYVLTYQLPQQWLAEEERQWPVILDPVIETSIERTNIQDILVSSNAESSPYGSFLEVGYLENRGISRSYVNFTELPSLSSADVILSAYMQMGQMWYRAVSVPAEVHKVTSAWDQDTITWSNQPTYDNTIVDFVMGNNSQYYYWDVTDIVQEWYNEGEHLGLVFKTSDSIENAGVEKFRQFYSANYGYDHRPVLKIIFRNNNGLESYWDYTSASAGRAGTGYVNTYSGNLIWTRTDMSITGNLMPVTVSYSYNTNDAANNSFGMGYGWRSCFNELVYQWDEDQDGTIQSDETYYIWEDSDGTRHYFAKESSNKYKDEDGLELTLETSGSGSSRTYTIKDKNGNTRYYDTQGRLHMLENNQAEKSCIEITYIDSESKLIHTVKDGALRYYTFAYGDDGLLDKVSYTSTSDDNTVFIDVDYGYTDGNLTSVTYQDNKAVTYSYASGHLLTNAADIDGYRLTYTYITENSDFAAPRIASVSEQDLTDDGNYVSGGMLFFRYEQNQTKVQSGYRNAEGIETVESTLYYQFNNWGNTVCIQDDEGRAQYADFARNEPGDTAGKGNQLTLSSKLQNTVVNLLSDSSFESGTTWEAVSNCTGTIADTGYLGNKSLLLTSSENGYLRSGNFTAKAGKTYTFSAYVKSNSGTVMLGIHGSPIAWSDSPSSGDWKRLEVSYTNNSQTDETIYAIILGISSANAYIDCVQLEEAPNASRYNLVSDGDFSLNTTLWTGTCLADGDIVAAAPASHPLLSANAYKITGEYTTEKSVKQTIPVSGGEGDSFVFGGWAMGQSVSVSSVDESITKDFSIKCTIHYEDDTTEEQIVQFNPNVTQWQLVSGTIAAKKAYSSISIEVVYKNNANTVYFDGLQLFKEEFGVSYTYDNDGNVISVIDLQKKETEYEYDSNNNLTSIIEDGNTKMTYTYDNYHNVLTATTEEGQVYNFTYDAYGNNTQVSITENGSTISSQAAYTANGNYLDYTTDALGNVTRYGYDADTGLLEWVQYPEDTEATRTEYTYDEMYRTATVTADLYNGTEDTELTLSASYTYEDDLLSTIVTPTETYTFQYGDFSLRSKILIGSNTLVSYTYEDYTNRLKKLDYGNQDSVSYTYDNHGRLILETFEDGQTVSYQYDNSDNLAMVTDSETGVVTTYYYDLLNRQSGYREKSSSLDHSVRYEYDAKNNLSSMTETVNGTTRTYSYSYDSYNRLTSMTVDGVTVAYTYDDFGRLTKQETKQGETVILTEEVGYSAGIGENTTSGQIASYNGFTYTYDKNGNILSVSDGTHTTSYEYDSQNQLTRENNQAQGYTHVWEYDNAGNIQSRTEYAYTNGTLGSPTGSITYTYNSSIWRDLLRSYGNSARFSYDNVGNITSDGVWTYWWKHGRQLAYMKQGSTIRWDYTYDANGLRTKRTDGTNTYTYVYNGSKLTAMTKGTDKLYFTYDASGVPLTVVHNNVTYYYKTNLQGDVIGIVNSSGTAVVTYAYDAWGKLLVCTDTTTSSLGTLNPLRYRGYVYDTETALYYLQSRYYNPEWGRFINADALVSTGQGFIGKNMFAYCLNNPITRVDYLGYAPGDLFDTPDEAARDFAMIYAQKGYDNRIEYASLIYSVSIIETHSVLVPINIYNLKFSFTRGLYFEKRTLGFRKQYYRVSVTKYTYMMPNSGTEDFVYSPQPPCTLNIVAKVHNHTWIPGHYNNHFSPIDLTKNILAYVSTPSGTLRKYDPNNPSTEPDGATEIYWDTPIDPRCMP